MTVDEQPQAPRGASPNTVPPNEDHLIDEDIDDGLDLDDPALRDLTLRENLTEVWQRLPTVGRAGAVLAAILLVVLSCSVVAAILGEITTTTAPNPAALGSPTALVSSPTATTSPELALAKLVQRAIGPQATSVRADIDPTFSVIGVVVTVGEQADLATAQETVKFVVFDAQSAIWQEGGYAPDTVVVTVIGPNFHSGVISTGEYGEAKLSAKTVAQLNWDALTPDTAWSQYDAVALLGSGVKSTQTPASS